MGVTILGDVIILLSVAILLPITQSLCSQDGFPAVQFVFDILVVLASLVWGYILGFVIIFLIEFKYIKFLILPIGFFTFVACDAITAWTAASSDYRVYFDGFLICTTAGWVTGTYSTNRLRYKFIRHLKELSNHVFVPFFTQVGVVANAPVLIQTIGFSISAALVRLFAMAAGSYVGGSFSDMDERMRRTLWIGLIPQSGVSLSLLGVIARIFDDTWGPYFQATVTGIILVNQLFGPYGVRYVITSADEQDKADLHDKEEHPWLDTLPETLIHRVDAATQWDAKDEVFVWDVDGHESESLIGDKDSIREARSPGLDLDNDRELLELDGNFDEDQIGRVGHSEGGLGYMTLETLAKRMDKVIGNIVGLSERDPFSVDALNKRRARTRLNSRSEHEYDGDNNWEVNSEASSALRSPNSLHMTRGTVAGARSGLGITVGAGSHQYSFPEQHHTLSSPYLRNRGNRVRTVSDDVVGGHMGDVFRSRRESDHSNRVRSTSDDVVRPGTDDTSSVVGNKSNVVVQEEESELEDGGQENSKDVEMLTLNTDNANGSFENDAEIRLTVAALDLCDEQ